MGEFRSRIRITVLVVLLLGVAVASMVADRPGAGGGGELPSWAAAVLDLAMPVQQMIAAPVDVVADAWVHYVDLVDVREENDELRSRIAALEEDNLQLREALVASGRLERIAAMRERYEIPMLPAELVGVDVSPWFRSVMVDKGRGDGVRSGMPVISENGLAGLVTATSRRASRTMLLLDRQSAVDATIQRSRARGILRGVGASALEFEFVDRGSDVQVGDLVITSGLDGVYPKGLRIGEVAEVSDPDAGLVRTAVVEPAVDFGRLEQVFVMLHRGPTMDLLYEEEGGVAAVGAGDGGDKP